MNRAASFLRARPDNGLNCNVKVARASNFIELASSKRT